MADLLRLPGAYDEPELELFIMKASGRTHIQAALSAAFGLQSNVLFRVAGDMFQLTDASMMPARFRSSVHGWYQHDTTANPIPYIIGDIERWLRFNTNPADVTNGQRNAPVGGPPISFQAEVQEIDGLTVLVFTKILPRTIKIGDNTFVTVNSREDENMTVLFDPPIEGITRVVVNAQDEHEGLWDMDGWGTPGNIFLHLVTDAPTEDQQLVKLHEIHEDHQY